MIKTCQRCGILFRAVGNMKYCVVCSYEVEREYQTERQRRWREVNRDKAREYDRRYRERHRERFNANHREYYRRQKLKLIREILSATATVLNRKEHIT